MRVVIVVVIAAVFGGILGMLGARARLVPELVAAVTARDTLEEENSRLSRELSYAAERVQFMGIENEALLKQVEALQNLKGLSAQDAALHESYAALEAGSEGAVSSSSPSAPQRRPGQAPSSVSAASTYTQPPAAAQPKEAQEAPLVLEQRRRLADLLQEAIDQTTDPFEKERLGNLRDHLKYVRDLYTSLRAAQSFEERRAILGTIAQTRANMKALVQDQRNALMRRSLEENGVSDAGLQDRVIASIETLQENPYWTEPMLIWGMAAPEAAE